MAVLLWFGDSYTVGNELGYVEGPYQSSNFDKKIIYLDKLDRARSRPDLAFPTLVSEKLEKNFSNYGCGGASIQFMEFSLYNFIKHHRTDTESYIGVFCFPGQYNRHFTVKEDNSWIYQTSNNISTHILKQQIENSHYETTITLNAIFSTCKAYNIIPFFVSSWIGLETKEEYNIVPEDSWLLPKNKSLVEYSWDFAKPSENWRSSIKNKNIYDKFIYPCENHPNVIGHKKIAEDLSNLLIEKNI